MTPRILATVLGISLGLGLAGCQTSARAARTSSREALGDQVRAWTTPPPPGHDLVSQHAKLVRDDAPSRSFTSKFIDKQDGMFDMSQWLGSRTGFLPLVSPITEPAVGFGALGALAFFDNGDDDYSRLGPPPAGRRKAAPNVAVVGGLATENGTWGVLGGYMGNWKNDTIRYAGGLGHASVTLDYYGRISELTGRPIELTIKGQGTVQDLSFRLGDSEFFLGARYTYFDSTVRSARLRQQPEIRPLEFSSQNAAIGLTLTYDTRDNTFTPNEGVRAQATFNIYDDIVGGDFSYHELEVYWLAWRPLCRNLNLGVRLDGQFVDEGAPFYAKPFINLRGIPAMRYLGDNVLVAETELRWDVTPRWSLVGFAGAGRTTNEVIDLWERDRRDIVDSAWNVGAGFRYLVARALGLRMGIDIARGPEDWAIYFTTGNGWLRL